MRIDCPSCAATYEVPDRLLAGPARTLRCSRCGADFALPSLTEPAPAPPPVEAAPPPAPQPEPEPVPAPAPAPAVAPMRPEPLAVAVQEPVVEDAHSSALVAAWVLSLLVVAAAVGGAVLFRAEVMAFWPPSARLFAALGLT